MALRAHTEWLKGIEKDNLSWVSGVKVEEKQIKGYDFFGRIRGQTRFEGKIATIPWQRYRKCLLVFLNIHRLIRKRTEIPL